MQALAAAIGAGNTGAISWACRGVDNYGDRGGMGAAAAGTLLAKCFLTACR